MCCVAADAGGVCSLDQDGFYYISYTMIVVGLLIGLWLMRVFPRLDKLPLERWRAKPSSITADHRGSQEAVDSTSKKVV
jgi:hypothetical protein